MKKSFPHFPAIKQEILECVVFYNNVNVELNLACQVINMNCNLAGVKWGFLISGWALNVLQSSQDFGVWCLRGFADLQPLCCFALLGMAEKLNLDRGTL